jgi:hypothetical protein
VIYIVYVLVAVIGAAIQILREGRGDTARMVEIAIVWWIVVMIGVAGIVGGLFHIFDGPAIAKEIGFTRGDGGFQMEVGFGDLGLGIAAVLCIWIRDRFMLAVLIVAAVSLWGDAYGHIHQEIVNDNHDPDNTGPVLYTDILVPLVGLALYGVRERLGRR